MFQMPPKRTKVESADDKAKRHKAALGEYSATAVAKFKLQYQHIQEQATDSLGASPARASGSRASSSL